MKLLQNDYEKYLLTTFKTDYKSILKEVSYIYRAYKANCDGKKIYDSFEKLINKIEYATGGYVVQRGYYSHNIHKTFTVGGCNRGKLLKKRSNKSKVSYEFGYFNENLLMIKSYHEHDASRLATIEFVERLDDIEVGIEFDVFDGIIEEAATITINQFENARIKSNRVLYGLSFLPDDIENIELEYFEYEKNWYEYKDNILVKAKHFEYNNDIHIGREELVEFVHDDDGCPVEFIIDNDMDYINPISKVNQDFYRKYYMY